MFVYKLICAFIFRYLQTSPKPQEARHNKGGYGDQSSALPHPALRREWTDPEPVQCISLAGEANDMQGGNRA